MDKKILLFAVIINCFAWTAKAYDFSAVNDDGQTIYYNITSSVVPRTVEVTNNGGANSYSGAIVIPDMVNYNEYAYTVISIGDSAFMYCYDLTSIDIPNSVTSIGELAFLFCTGLTSVNIPNSVISIETGAFRYCNGLTSINIPNSVILLEYASFESCSSLLTINVEDSNLNYSSEDGVLFNKNKTILIEYPCGKAGSYIIPNSVTYIEHVAFRFCRSLTSINIPNSVTSIGWQAFDGCSGLTSITIPNSVISIEMGAFNGCSALTSVTIPNSVTSIVYVIFEGCSSLLTINVEDGNLNYSSEDGVLFNKNKTILIEYPGGKAGSYNIPNSVAYIGDVAFQSCISLPSITIPNSVTSIGRWAFVGCSALTSITSLAVTPPTLATGALEGVPTTIPVYVLCGSLAAYQGVSGWNDFTNYHTIEQADTVVISATICAGAMQLQYDIQPPYATGTYYLHLTGINGCDSVVVLNLTVDTVAVPAGLSIENVSNGLKATWSGNYSSYEVYRNGTLLTTVTTTEFTDNTVSAGQQYCYKIKAINGDCTSEFSHEVCQTITAINNVDLSELQLYPNPAKNELFIHSDSPINKVEIYNFAGVCVLSENNFAGSVNISSLAAGVYSAKIYSAEGVATRKMIVN
jgi:hypothetical protein